MKLRLLRALGALLLFAGLAGGCGVETDERPATRAFIVAAILTPSCANGGCHSSAAAVEGYSFGTLDEATAALNRLVAPGDPNRSLLMRVLRSSGEERMPLDAPLPDDDIALIEKWIQGGAQ
ncbi:MAG: hypothetical protein R3B48_26275 [Kofleriaceae bacterium]